MRPWVWAALLVLGGPTWAAPGALEASRLIEEGRLDEARDWANAALATDPDDADALVVAGTVELLAGAQVRRDESIFHPETNPRDPGEPTVPPALARRVAALWSRAAERQSEGSSLWADVIELTFRSGAPELALEYARRVVADPRADAPSLGAAATVLVLNLEAGRAAQAWSRVPDNRSYRLFEGLEAWRLGQPGWRASLEAFLAQNPTPAPGTKLAAYLLSPAMRDTEAGFQTALQVEDGLAGLVVRQKWVQKYPDRFVGRFGLARALVLWGSYPQALTHYAELERRGLAPGPDEREAIAFQRAWALEAWGHGDDALPVWTALTASRDFYYRSAASWFVGSRALAQGHREEARALWTRRFALPAKPKGPAPEPLPAVAEEPARSKYAFWAHQALEDLGPAP